jgi:hypothetical protein
MPKKVELLEHHTDSAALQYDLSVTNWEQPASRFLVTDQLIVDINLPLLINLELIDAPEEGALSRSRRADDAKNFPTMYV